MVEPPRVFAQQLRSLRESQGLSVRALADLVGVSSVTIWKWEKGECKPRARLLTPLAKALDVAPNHLRAFATGHDDFLVPVRPEDFSHTAVKAQALTLAEDAAPVEALADVIAKAKQMIAEVSGLGPNNITIRIEY